MNKRLYYILLVVGAIGILFQIGVFPGFSENNWVYIFIGIGVLGILLNSIVGFVQLAEKRAIDYIETIGSLSGTIMMMTGVIFRIQHYPGSGILIIIGSLLMAVGFFVSFFNAPEQLNNEVIDDHLAEDNLKGSE